MVTKVETDLHEKQTAAFIDYAPVGLVFHRTLLIADGAGGKMKQPSADIVQQRVRVVGLVKSRSRTLPDGRDVTVDKVLVGMPTLDVEEGDLFEHLGQGYEVVNVQRSPNWRVDAEVVSRG